MRKAFHYTTTENRAVFAMGVGALLGGILTGFVNAFTVAPFKLSDLFNPTGLADMFAISGGVGVVAIGVFLGGLLLLASPIWYFLHQRGYRSIESALLLGSALTGIINIGLESMMAGTFSSIYALPMTIVGGVVGAVIWRIAYRRNSIS